MPSRKTRTGEFKDIAHPINSEFRQRMQARILETFDKEAANLHSNGRDGNVPVQG
jgi:DNA-binding cell septation regulator SpoVG